MVSFTSTSLHSLPSYSPLHFFFYLALKSMANSINSLLPRDQFPVGFRFYPTDQELIQHYLRNKVWGNDSLVECIRQIDTLEYEPWQLPELLSDGTGFEKWFFFSVLVFMKSNSSKCHRTTKFGFWKSTGKDREIRAPKTDSLIGTKKTLVFHCGRAGKWEQRTNWVIHEYRLRSDTTFADSSPLVICRLKKKSDKKVSEFDEPNGLVNSTLENTSSLCQSTGQPALPGIQPINASDRQSIQPGASEDYFDPSDLLDLLHSPRQPALPDFQFTMNAFEYFDDATSKMSSFASRLEPEPAFMGFQLSNDNDVGVTDRALWPRPSESEINFANCLKSLENDNSNEVTSKYCDNDEWSNMDVEPQYDGFSSDTDNEAALRWKNNPVPPSYYNLYSSSAMQNVPTIKESRRSPLTGKRFQYREEKESYPHEVVFQGSSCESIYGEENEIYPSEELRSSSDNYLLQAGRVSRDTSDDETFVGQHIRPRISPTGKRFQYKEENEINPAQELQSSFDETLSVIILFFFLFFLFLCFSFFVFMSIRASLNVLRLILRDNRLALLIITLLLFQPLIVIVK